jgi:hypothetical protein
VNPDQSVAAPEGSHHTAANRLAGLWHGFFNWGVRAIAKPEAGLERSAEEIRVLASGQAKNRIKPQRPKDLRAD